jgi:hypothetical protein
VTEGSNAALRGGVTREEDSNFGYQDDSADLGVYGGQQAQRCPDCGHVSPSAEFLEVHLVRRCCGTLGLAA